MPLLLPMTAPADPFRAEVPIAFDLAAATFASPLPPEAEPKQRARVVAALLEGRYAHILDTRLAHIPVRLPYPRKDVIARLRENDRESPGWREQQRFLEVDADLRLLEREIASSRPRAKGGDPKQRRLSRIWDYLSLQTEWTRMTVQHRGGRLRNNVSIFLRSDLPSWFLSDIGASSQWEIAALVIALNAHGQGLVQRLTDRPAEEVSKEAFLRTRASLQQVEAAFRHHQQRFRETSLRTDKILEWRDALEYYVDLFSAPDLRTFRVPREIRASTLDASVLDGLSQGLRDATSEVRRTLAEDYPGGLAEFRWRSPDDPDARALVRLALDSEAG